MISHVLEVPDPYSVHAISTKLRNVLVDELGLLDPERGLGLGNPSPTNHVVDMPPDPLRVGLDVLVHLRVTPDDTSIKLPGEVLLTLGLLLGSPNHAIGGFPRFTLQTDSLDLDVFTESGIEPALLARVEVSEANGGADPGFDLLPNSIDLLSALLLDLADEVVRLADDVVDLRCDLLPEGRVEPSSTEKTESGAYDCSLANPLRGIPLSLHPGLA